MPLPDGASFDRTDKRYVILASGMRVTRSEAESIEANNRGFTSHRQYLSHMKSLHDPHGHYNALYRDAQTNGIKKRDFEKQISQVDWSDNSPEGSKAEFLAFIGRRPRGADWAIGQTNEDTSWF